MHNAAVPAEITGIALRALCEHDLPRLPALEREAGSAFRGLGMDAVADGELPTVAELRPYVSAGRGWVAADGTDTAIGYLIARVVDGCGHIEQVSVLPSWTRRRIGRALIGRALAWATAQRFAAVTLTTFTEVPWNGPYYERLGFRYLEPAEIGPQLAAIRAEEARQGLDAWPRACMRKVV